MGESHLTVRVPLGALTVTAPRPTLVSQRTCEEAFGIPRRRFLEALPRFRACGGEVLELGRLRLVAPDDFVAWLRDQRAGEEHEAEGDEADAMAKELGLKVVGGRG